MSSRITESSSTTISRTDPSFRLSLTSDDDEGYTHCRPKRGHHHESSVEYSRHLSEPSAPDFPSFLHRSSEHFADEGYTYGSYRSGDEEGLNPYGGDTVPTAAHHASAFTLSAAWGGGQATLQRDPSMSGAEYDPDRPLHAMIPGIDSKHNMFDPDPSKHQVPFFKNSSCLCRSHRFTDDGDDL